MIEQDLQVRQIATNPRFEAFTRFKTEQANNLNSSTEFIQQYNVKLTIRVEIAEQNC